MNKRYLLLALILVFSVFICMLSSCDKLDIFLPGDSGVTPPPDDVPPSTDDPETPPVENNTIKFTIRDKSTDDRITYFVIEKGTAPISDEAIMSAIENARNRGYGFVSWYTDKNKSTEDYIFNPETPLYEDTTIYGDRGNLAGENLVWSYDIDKGILTISGSGDMYDFKYNEDAPWIKYAALVNSIVFEGEITSIGDHAFYNFTALTSVKLPDSIVKIGKNSFYDSSIKHINFPASLLSIGVQAFRFCDGLTELEFNQGLEEIGDGAFNGCYNIENVILTDKIAALGTSAFQDCTNLQTAYYMGTEEQYNNMVFLLDNFWVKQLANTYYISEEKPAEPGPYWHLGENGEIINWYYTIGYFSSNNTSNAKVPFAFDYVDPEIGITQQHIDYMNSLWYHGYQFASWYNKATNKRYTMRVGTKLTSDLRLRGDRGRRCGDNLTWSRSGSVLTISGTGAMWDFEKSSDAPWYGYSYSEVVISAGVNYIGSNSFCNNPSLKFIDIPTNVLGIHQNAFLGNVNFRYIYYLGDKTQVGSVVGLMSLVDIGEAKVYTYTEQLGAKDIAYWTNIEGTDLSGRVAWRFEDGTLYVGGNESLINYQSFASTPWAPFASEVDSVVIISGANRIGANSFSGMANLTSATIPASVLKISATAFVDTYLYNNIEGYTDGALYITNHLIRVEPTLVGDEFRIKEGTLSIAENAFEGCTTVKAIIFNKEIVGVYRGALAGLCSLEKIFFTGTSISAWDSIWGTNNNLESQELDDVVIYCFSKYEPRENGNWWYYGTGLVLEIWPQKEDN